MFRKMLVFNFRFFLLNVLIWFIFMIGIKIMTFLSFTDPGVFQNVQLLNPRCTGSQKIKKTKAGTVLLDTLYIYIYEFITYTKTYYSKVQLRCGL